MTVTVPGAGSRSRAGRPARGVPVPGARPAAETVRPRDRRSAHRKPSRAWQSGPAPHSLVAPARRSLLSRVAFPLVVVAVLCLGGWGTSLVVAGAQGRRTSVVPAPAAASSWGHLVALRTTVWTRPAPAVGAPGGGVVVDVVVRLVGAPAAGAATGVFRPSTVTLRAGDGRETPVNLGALRPVRIGRGQVLEGHLAFAVDRVGESMALVLREGPGPGRQVALHPATSVVPEPGLPSQAWAPGT